MTSNNGPPATATPVLAPLVSQPVTGKSLAAKTEAPVRRDGFREVVETIVFVTVLVLLLKTFVAEAFVIPTGSMAETLLGYRRIVTCPDCGIEFPVNCSEEVAPQRGNKVPVEGCTCPNCAFHDVWIRNGQPVENPPAPGSGDRVLVAKWPWQEFTRWAVVVFKYPQEPQKSYEPLNYIKRCIGLPGETIAINHGDLFVNRGTINYAEQDQPAREPERWRKPYTYANAQVAQQAFVSGQFDILRKPPAQMLAMRRLVFDNDFQPRSLVGIVPPRWSGEAGWQVNDAKRPTEFRRAGGGEAVEWLRYQNLVVNHAKGDVPPAGRFKPEFITNVMGYNSADSARMAKGDEGRYWVGDLMLECEVETAGAGGRFVMELSKGKNRFGAEFDTATGECRLLQRGPVEEKELARRPTTLRGPGRFAVRFANFDERLTVWVNDALPFGDGVDADGDRSGRPDDVNDKQPAGIGFAGAGGTVRHLRLWRDTYYTAGGFDPNHRAPGEPELTLFVQPGHYLCLGDNSTQSSDGRDWGLVPERLFLGRAVMVYFPVWPLANRFGPIR
jgi:signal peptidase I